MPITPFHFGPGAALNSLSPQRISFVAFVAANVLIDIEPLYYMLTQQFPLHRFFHTYIGATIVAPCAILVVLASGRVSKKLSPRIYRAFFSSSTTSIVVGSALGAYSHIVLDSIMHSDIQPLAPFSAANALHDLVPLASLHWFCVFAGIFGVVLLGLRHVIKSSR